MLCFVHRWSISRSLDEGKPLSRRAARHVEACPRCAAFYAQCLRLERELAAHAEPLAAPVSPALHEAILRRCRAVSPLHAGRASNVDRAEAPRGDAAPWAGPVSSASAGGRTSRGRRRRLFLRPQWALAAAAAAALAVFVSGYFLAPRPTPTLPIIKNPPPSPPAKAPGAEWLWPDVKAGSASVASLEEVLESPVEREIRLLQEDGKAAADILLACVPLDIGLRGK